MADGRIKDGNYILIQSFMVKDLGLKGNELLVYAIIYGFSQAEEQTFSGSRQYLADWTNSTKQGIDKNLKSLLDKGLIQKRAVNQRGVNLVDYYTTELSGVDNKVYRGGQLSCPNNIEDNIADNKEIIKETRKRKKVFTPPTYEEVEAYCLERNSPVDPKAFFDYFTAGQWTDSKGNPVLNWKQKLITWEKRRQGSGQSLYGNAQNNTARHEDKWASVRYDN